MTWLRAHWKLCALVASHLAIGAIGWALHRRPPAPAVELHTASGYEGAETQTVQVVEKLGPVRIVRRTVTKPGPGCAGPEVEETETEDRGEASRESNSQAEAHASATERSDLKVTPAARPSKALGFRFDDPFGAKQFRVDAGVRVFDTPFWLRPGWKPADGLRGLSLGAEVQW